MYQETSTFITLIPYVVTIVAIIIALMIAMPPYSVWSALKRGQAELAQAKNEQMVQVTQAEGRLKAAEMNKKAAIIEAEAVAKQIETIGENLQKHDLYLKWQWIKMMEERDGDETIYVPTEANMPILEANRFLKQQDRQQQTEES